MTVNGLDWRVWVLYVNREVAMVLLMQLECEWIVVDKGVLNMNRAVAMVLLMQL